MEINQLFKREKTRETILVFDRGLQGYSYETYFVSNPHIVLSRIVQD